MLLSREKRGEEQDKVESLSLRLRDVFITKHMSADLVLGSSSEVYDGVPANKAAQTSSRGLLPVWSPSGGGATG
jgi:hypothetical protein